MKKAIFFIILIVAAFIAYSYFRTGTLTLIPSGSNSEEALELKDLEKEFKAARQAIAQAERSAGVGGIDTTADMEAALRQIKQIDQQLQDLKAKNGAQELRDRIENLENEIKLIKEKFL